MADFVELYNADLNRYCGDVPRWNKNFSLLFRRIQTSKNNLYGKLLKKIYYRYISTHGIEIDPDCKIGAGLYIGHPYNITINPSVIIGENCSIHKGVTIGQENRGRRKGTPILCDSVWVGVNATIVGKIIINEDVLVCPNAFVNCDVPSHSIVIGNPCKIIHKEHATKDYIEWKNT